MTFKEKYSAFLAEDLATFQGMFKQSLGNYLPELDDLFSYISSVQGKQVRPGMVFLFNRLFGEVSPSAYHCAVCIELIHTATLLHDDVVDSAHVRRGKETINAKWDAPSAILSGDYILARSIGYAIETEQPFILKEISAAIEQMSQGELSQMYHAKKLDVTLEDYYTIIEKKTAVLFAISAAAGVKCSSQGIEKVKKAKELGRLIGLAFQIKDDILDYIPSSSSKKGFGNDIQENKITLPLLLALPKLSNNEKEKIQHIFQLPQKSDEEVQWILKKVLDVGGLEAAQTELQSLSKEALNILHFFEGDAHVSVLIEELILWLQERTF